MHSMATLQDMDIVAHVHDEVISECAPDVSVEQVCHLMEQPPERAGSSDYYFGGANTGN